MAYLKGGDFMTQIAVITEATTIYDSELDKFLVFVTFTTAEPPKSYHCWFATNNISAGEVNKDKLVKLLKATSAKSIEDMYQKIIRVNVEYSIMTAFSHPNEEGWVKLYD